MLYLQLPKDGAHDAGQRRPIALLPQVYRLWSAACKQDVQHLRQVCRDRGEVPVGAGALDETFALAFKTGTQKPVGLLRACASCQTGAFCATLYALNVALNMYSRQSRIQTQGAVSEAVQATCGLPLGCGLAVDLLHAFQDLVRTL
eukprot:4064989-Amphidinium_carterae.2